MNVRPLSDFLRYAEHALYEKLIPPPLPPSPKFRPIEGDYSHTFLFEELFCNGLSDVEGALEISRSTKGPVLDLGGGKGRFSVALARAGTSVTLVDNSASMLAKARERRDNLPPEARERFRIVQQDMTRMRFATRHPLVVSLGITIPYLRDPAAIVEAFRRVRETLTDDGTFYFDIHDLRSLERGAGWRTGRWKYWRKGKLPAPARRLWGRTFSTSDESTTLENAIRLEDGSFLHLSTRYYAWNVERWKTLLVEAGLRLTAVYRDWQLTPFGPLGSVVVLRAERD